MDWKSIGGTIAKLGLPLLSGAIGGPAGVAVAGVGKLIANALGCEETPDAVDAAIKADPEAYLKLRTAEMANKVELEELKLKHEELYLSDKDSARNREVEMTKAGSKEYTQGFLVYATVIGFFGTMFALFQVDAEPAMKDTLLVLVGILGSQYREVQGYFFGAARGSAKT